ncbi:bacterioferritin [Pontibacterium granulatum]|uniref:bacterioferritin n=1 Tax=Pontibacterium granulatum TaxID=2036029 RepID=UPI00249C64FF|nr:bacterioferritin [Pontibacterium granulatum]MDI3323181.1 bacterioferritin [Pontibacterium granulatum]
MKGNTKIIGILNKLLTNEMSAADQYFIHSRMYEDWGLKKLHKRISHEQEEELEHASALVERILFLEGTPDVASRDPLKVGKDVPEMLKNDLQVEYEVGQALKDAIAVCEQEKDYQTREILEVLLRDTEEDHTYWLEQQLGLIDKIGIQNYLQSQMG